VAPAVGSVAVVWHGGPGERPVETRNYDRLRPIFDAFSDADIAVEPVLYCDQMCGAVRDQLLRVDGVLVWIDPISGDEGRGKLDSVLRDVSSHGVWVSAHPDTIEKMGTKEVLYRTKSLGWGTDTHLYTTVSEFRAQFPARLAGAGPRVLKQRRGNGGTGVWKVALADGATNIPTNPAADTIVRIQHAAPRDETTQDVTLGGFMQRCEEYFADAGKLIDQPFVTRLAEGMIRAYLIRSDVVGFPRQQPAPTNPDATSIPLGGVLVLPSAKTMHDVTHPKFGVLRTRLECDWVPALRQLVGVKDDQLPLIWDADFLYGPPTDTGDDTHILCEINVSSVLPFPQHAPRALASAVRQCLGAYGPAARSNR
jgi:hypothetical protein